MYITFHIFIISNKIKICLSLKLLYFQLECISNTNQVLPSQFSYSTVGHLMGIYSSI